MTRTNEEIRNFNDFIRTIEKPVYEPEKVIKLPDNTEKYKTIHAWGNINRDYAHEESILKDMTYEIFHEALLQKRLNCYQIGFAACFADIVHYDAIGSALRICKGRAYEDCSEKTRKFCDDSEKCKTKVLNKYPMHGLTYNEICIYWAYYTYVTVRAKRGRTINDIIDIEPKYISELGYLNADKYDKIDDFEKLFLKKTKIGMKVLRMTVSKINSDDNITVEEAFEQAKTEYEEELKQKKTKRESDLLKLVDVDKIKDENVLLKKNLEEYKSLIEEQKKQNDGLKIKCDQLQAEMSEIRKELDKIKNSNDRENESPNQNINVTNEIMHNEADKTETMHATTVIYEKK